MRVLVTGAAGFIGQHLVRILQERHVVRTCDKRRGRSTSDTGWPEWAATCQPDIIVHLGANCSTRASLRDPRSDFIDNALGTLHVCEASRRAGDVPILYTSTVKVQPGYDGKIAPLGQSKRVGEQYLRRYHEWFGIPYVILRPSTVYGPGQDATADAGWFTWFAKAALAGERIEVAGDGTQSRDVLYIDDFVALLVDIVEHFNAYTPYDLLRPVAEVGGGPDNEVSLNELLAELGHSNVVTVPRLPGDLQRVVCDNERVSRPRGWKPTVGWRDGLARTRAWLETRR